MSDKKQKKDKSIFWAACLGACLAAAFAAVVQWFAADAMNPRVFGPYIAGFVTFFFVFGIASYWKQFNKMDDGVRNAVQGLAGLAYLRETDEQVRDVKLKNIEPCVNKVHEALKSAGSEHPAPRKS